MRRAAKTRARIAQWATEVVDRGRTQGLSAASALVRIPFPPRLLAARVAALARCAYWLRSLLLLLLVLRRHWLCRRRRTPLSL